MTEEDDRVGQLILKDFQNIPYEQAQTDYKSYSHAAHGLIYAIDDHIAFESYNTRAAILMQMRFDGTLGFPGGLVDTGEIPLDGVNREMAEEIDLDLTKHSFTHQHHLMSCLSPAKHLVLHFFVQEVNLQDFQEIEARNLRSKDYGCETFGILRPPLFTMTDGLRGFPAFLANNFAGNSRDQLISALLSTNIMSEEEIKIALEKTKKIKSLNL